mmetsp:Transcript_4780/g.11685  ORF Transcript_4780/g.11685 Transcript_4780/m.11685 type:complete len:271 (-) Transcript_4780:13-825(-)
MGASDEGDLALLHDVCHLLLRELLLRLDLQLLLLHVRRVEHHQYQDPGQDSTCFDPHWKRRNTFHLSRAIADGIGIIVAPCVGLARRAAVGDIRFTVRQGTIGVFSNSMPGLVPLDFQRQLKVLHFTHGKHLSDRNRLVIPAEVHLLVFVLDAVVALIAAPGMKLASKPNDTMTRLPDVQVNVCVGLDFQLDILGAHRNNTHLLHGGLPHRHLVTPASSLTRQHHGPLAIRPFRADCPGVAVQVLLGALELRAHDQSDHRQAQHGAEQRC